MRINKDRINFPAFSNIYWAEKPYPILFTPVNSSIPSDRSHNTYKYKIGVRCIRYTRYFNKRTLSTVLMRGNYTMLGLCCRSLAKSELVSKVSTYRYKTMLGCDPQKMRTNGFERRRKSSKAFQYNFWIASSKLPRALSLSLFLSGRTGLCEKWLKQLILHWLTVNCQILNRGA